MRSDKPMQYQIAICGKIDSGWSDWLGALSVKSETATVGCHLTLLTGPIPDQAALRGILNKLWDLNLTLISVNQLATISVP